MSKFRETQEENDLFHSLSSKTEEVIDGPLVEGWFDGAVEPKNPGGHGAYGALVKVESEVVYAHGDYIGVGPTISNNVAEFSGFIDALRHALEYPGPIIVRGDSKLVLFTLTGQYKVHGGLYVPFFEKARALYQPHRERIQLEWIPREENSECDKLSKGVLHNRGIRFRIQPEPPTK